MNFSPTDLERYRQRLLDLRAQLRGDVQHLMQGALGGSGSDGNRMPIHMAELGTAASTCESNLMLSQFDQRTLSQVDAALARIASGTYGICTATGRRIPKSRLNAVPYAEHCIEYARQLERRMPKVLSRRSATPRGAAPFGVTDSPRIKAAEWHRTGVHLLNQQLWCWGQDALFAGGNLLVRHGFQRTARPTDQLGSSIYRLELGGNRRIVLRGFGVFIGDDRRGGMFLKRFEFSPWITPSADLRTLAWQVDDLPTAALHASRLDLRLRTLGPASSRRPLPSSGDCNLESDEEGTSHSVSHDVTHMA
jgi:RNA polymerase-binding transcription factor DksA